MADVRKQVSKSEQICSDKSIILDYDQPLLKVEDILNVYKSSLGLNCSVERYKNHNVYKYVHNNKTEYFLTSSITYLSKPHPLFKKRCQTKPWFKEFYNEKSGLKDVKVRIIGIYHYRGLIVFVDFKIEDYIGRKNNSSAAHVYSNDIYQALEYGIFEKIDKNNNHITVIASDKFEQYLNGKTEGNNLISIFKNFNKEFPFNDWIRADVGITLMRDAKWPKWKETEWAGWYLEYLFNRYLETNGISEISYMGLAGTQKAFDFDLYFRTQNFYGDLKSSDIKNDLTPGNDQGNVLETITANKKLWYIIYEHETIKDISQKSEMAIKRMELIGTPYHLGGHISYKNRMKHSVKFKKMTIIELNKINMNEVLSEFRQGHQPSGTSRKPKFFINKRNIDNYAILTYIAS